MKQYVISALFLKLQICPGSIPEGPKSEDNTRVKVNPNIRQDTLKSAPSPIYGPLSWQLIKSTKLKLMEYMITILQ